MYEVDVIGGGFGQPPVLFVIFMVVILGLIVFAIVGGVREWHHNNQQPIVPVRARVTGKRQHTSWHHNADGISSSNTTYYVTFEFENQQRMEFHVKHSVYGMLAEGDVGTLQFQGSRFIDFQR